MKLNINFQVNIYISRTDNGDVFHELNKKRHLFSDFAREKEAGCYTILHHGIENKLKSMLKAKLNASLLLGLGG